jgi:glycolate oxidase
LMELNREHFAALERVLPAERVYFDEAELVEFAGDKWGRGDLADVLVRPRSTEEVSLVLGWASSHGVAVTTRGSGWGYVGGAMVRRGGILLSLDRMNGIREISGNDFVAVVEAGVVTGELQRAVRARGLFYPPDPASAEHCSIGGNVATNAGGPRCLKYGVTRQYVLGLEVVLADGRILELGGRSHKNVTGFDLLGLFVGSEGMLGVVTGATLKLLPYPAARLGVAAVFADLAGAARAVQAIFEAGLLPCACEIADEFTYRVFQRMNGEAETGGAHLLVEVDGSVAGTLAEIREVEAVLLGAGALSLRMALDEAGVEALWATRRQFSLALTASRAVKLNEDVVVPRGKLVELVRFAGELGKRYGVDIACFGHAGDGNIHVNLLLDSGEGAEAILDELFRQVLAWGGAITGEHGIGMAKARWWREAVSAEVDEVHRTVKGALDPLGILNPGKWL